MKYTLILLAVLLTGCTSNPTLPEPVTIDTTAQAMQIILHVQPVPDQGNRNFSAFDGLDSNIAVKAMNVLPNAWLYLVVRFEGTYSIFLVNQTELFHARGKADIQQFENEIALGLALRVNCSGVLLMDRKMQKVDRWMK